MAKEDKFDISNATSRKDVFLYFFSKKYDDTKDEEASLIHANSMADIICKNTGIPMEVEPTVKKDMHYWCKTLTGMSVQEVAVKYGPTVLEFVTTFAGGFIGAKTAVSQTSNDAEIVEFKEEPFEEVK